MQTLLNNLTTTEFLLFILVFISFFRLIIDLIKLFHPSQLFMKDGKELTKRR